MANEPRDMRSLDADARRLKLLSRLGLTVETTAAWMMASSALGLLAFIGLAGLVMGGDTRALDERILLALRNSADLADPIGPKWLEHYMRDITALGGFAALSLLVLGVAGFLMMTGKRAIALRIFAISLSGWLLSHGMKLLFLRPRPDVVPHGADFYAASFPSGHAMTSSVVYLTLAAALSRTTDDARAKAYIMALAAALTAIIGVSRLYLGVHWPTDVLGGWMLGAAWVGLTWTAFKWLDQRGQPL